MNSSQLSRRSLLSSGLLAGAGLTLPGCATAGRNPKISPAPLCWPKVQVDRSRLIRAVAGLRPYRPQGFVVREDFVGEKRVIHNYGHGGAGITLSWGTSKLAAEIGLRHQAASVAVVGAGVIGLSTARLLQEAGRSVTVYAAALPPDTTSNIAGGQFHPFSHFRKDLVTAEWRVQYRGALEYSWRRFQLMVGEDYGIRWLPTYVQGDTVEQLLPTFPPNARVLAPQEHPFPAGHIVRYDTMYIEPGRYLRQLWRDFRADGGLFHLQKLADRSDLKALPEGVIFNCTGLGARDLFGDETLMPIRGQLAVMLPQPEIQYAFNIEAGYMFPRSDGIVLGGTYERGEWSTEPDDADIDRIIASHAELSASWRCASVQASA